MRKQRTGEFASLITNAVAADARCVHVFAVVLNYRLILDFWINSVKWQTGISNTSRNKRNYLREKMCF